jgi:hypothetical protein
MVQSGGQCQNRSKSRAGFCSLRSRKIGKLQQLRPLASGQDRKETGLPSSLSGTKVILSWLLQAISGNQRSGETRKPLHTRKYFPIPFHAQEWPSVTTELVLRQHKQDKSSVEQEPRSHQSTNLLVIAAGSVSRIATFSTCLCNALHNRHAATASSSKRNRMIGNRVAPTEMWAAGKIKNLRQLRRFDY